MTSIQAYKDKKIEQIEQEIKAIEANYSNFLQEELKERNTGKVNIERIAELTQELKDIPNSSKVNSSDPYNIANLF